jgi:hypothetical protein
MPIQLFRTYQFQFLIFQIQSLLFSFTYCSAHKIVMNLSVSVSVVSVPVSDVRLQVFLSNSTLVNTYRFQFLLFQLQCLLFSFVYCSAYTVVLSLSIQFQLFSLGFCNVFAMLYPVVSYHYIPVLVSAFSVSVSAVQFQILHRLHSCHKPFSFSFCCSTSDIALLTQLF